MPLYEFRCRDCDDRFEVWLGTGDRHSDVTCPEGHGDTVRIFSPIAMTGRAAAGPAPSAPCGASCACHPG